MSFLAKMCWLHVESPLHVGAGQGVGFIDMPIMREQSTKWPIVPGSSLKGVIRAHFEVPERDRRLFSKAFGERDDKEALAGAIVFTDARVILFPVRSLYGTFAYVTSPLVLARLKRDMVSAQFDSAMNLPDVVLTDEAGLLCGEESKLASGGMVFLEEYDYPSHCDKSADAWSHALAEVLFNGDENWKRLFRERFAIVSDENFNFFCEHATEVSTRVRLDPNSKRVEGGALWYEESLPVETVLAGLVWCDKVYGNDVSAEDLMKAYCDNELRLQIGGKATVGKGCVCAVFSGEAL